MTELAVARVVLNAAGLATQRDAGPERRHAWIDVAVEYAAYPMVFESCAAAGVVFKGDLEEQRFDEDPTWLGAVREAHRAIADAVRAEFPCPPPSAGGAVR